MTSQQRQKLRDLQVAAAYMPRSLAQKILGVSTGQQNALSPETKLLLGIALYYALVAMMLLCS
jgi:hypothetical protein